jgi:hypothetical protein
MLWVCESGDFLYPEFCKDLNCIHAKRLAAWFERLPKLAIGCHHHLPNSPFLLFDANDGLNHNLKPPIASPKPLLLSNSHRMTFEPPQLSSSELPQVSSVVNGESDKCPSWI